MVIFSILVSSASRFVLVIGGVAIVLGLAPGFGRHKGARRGRRTGEIAP
jgi:hypothetical protein